MNKKLVKRIEQTVESLQSKYPTANQLLNEAMNDAIKWALPLYWNGTLPSNEQIEKLAIQLLAIVDTNYQ